MVDEKKRKEAEARGWIPVDPAPGPVPTPKAASRPVGPPTVAKEPIAPAAPLGRTPQQIRPEERRLWEDPVLSPWAQGGAAPQAPTPAPAATPVGSGEKGTTTCPRCGTAIVYPRYGAPPWQVSCPACGAQGRISK